MEEARFAGVVVFQTGAGRPGARSAESEARVCALELWESLQMEVCVSMSFKFLEDQFRDGSSFCSSRSPQVEYLTREAYNVGCSRSLSGGVSRGVPPRPVIDRA